MSNTLETTSYSPEDKKLGDVQDVIKDTTTGINEVKDNVEQSEDLGARLKKVSEWFNNKGQKENEFFVYLNDREGNEIRLSKTYYPLFDKNGNKSVDKFMAYVNHREYEIEYDHSLNKFTKSEIRDFSGTNPVILLDSPENVLTKIESYISLYDTQRNQVNNK